MRLRNSDIIRLIRLAATRLYGDGVTETAAQCCARSIERPVFGLSVRLVLIAGDKVLLRRHHLPLIEYSLSQHLAAITNKFLRSITDAVPKTEIKVACVEALPVPAYEHDGCCLTVVMEMSSSSVKQTAEQDGYRWVELTSDKDLSACIDLWRTNYATLRL